MKKMFLGLFALFIMTSCSTESNDAVNVGKETPEVPGEVVTTPFVEGKMVMSIYTKGINVGGLLDKIDYSKGDVYGQFQTLMTNLPKDENPFLAWGDLFDKKPMAAFALMMSMTKADYYVKNSTVLAKAKGATWQMDHFHSEDQDQASVYLKAMAPATDMPVENQTAYAIYTPSKGETYTEGSTIDYKEFNRRKLDKVAYVSNYACDVIEYTRIKAPSDPNNEFSFGYNKLLVYISPLFDKTINFTHSTYLPEDGGILKIEMYVDGIEEPFMVFQPEKVEVKTIADSELETRVSTPVYAIDDLEFSAKVLGIMFAPTDEQTEEPFLVSKSL
ncbi:hypothetical protein ACF8C4_16410 [Myroides odoratimimus]|uniref:Uncharacterized protein n=1 Tax=Myroides marinus TaxID=703342 RepID=A0A1H6YJH1_9FLAO|nr:MULTISPECIES: hypothetical protein [Myroides]EKB03345.1 hypothetical protein HMPREF9711_02672 [Myroides odoratimimus CCUG 3837]MDM1395898.1 hypothetical protein [Myroides odoratimimus]MEC4084935.1 hypothetical protein [Myroides odoratimimus]MVX35445.1 hypothetical protein [Myroides sp. LoEW2-1]SEJ37362.1 hypothetical protein SAMN04488018_12913 [Myroides marinus]